jgi:hypothetical protein
VHGRSLDGCVLFIPDFYRIISEMPLLSLGNRIMKNEKKSRVRDFFRNSLI